MEFHQYDAYEGRCPECGQTVVIRLYDTCITREVSLAWCAETHASPDGKVCGEGFGTVCDDPLTYVEKRIEAALKKLSGSET